MPLSVNSFAVPPVEMISMWYFLSSRDNSSTPLLWETLISARRMVVMECGWGNRPVLERGNFKFRRPLPQSIPSAELVGFELFAQGIAINPEDFRRFALIAFDVTHDDLEQRLFHFSDDHVVHAGGFLPIEVVEIAIQRLLYAGGERRFALLGHAANSVSGAGRPAVPAPPRAA